ncbi:MAG: hypothetical protein U1E26_00920 [Coriobacteriia bacterium]|nr:hypothetical protein [Coriobacteriia bacterium]
MRPLTFKGFLEAYVGHLSGRRTTSLAQLAPLLDSNKRLREPLVLWAVKNETSERLSTLLADDERVQAELRLLTCLEQEGRLEESLSREDSDLRPEYLKVWQSYVARRDAHARDERLKLAARKRALALETTRHVSRYRMAKDLGLNQGNLHAFLSQGNPSKLSLQRAYELVDYLEAACDSQGSASRPGANAERTAAKSG